MLLHTAAHGEPVEPSLAPSFDKLRMSGFWCCCIQPLMVSLSNHPLAPSFDKLRMSGFWCCCIQAAHGELVEPSNPILRQAQDERGLVLLHTTAHGELVEPSSTPSFDKLRMSGVWCCCIQPAHGELVEPSSTPSFDKLRMSGLWCCPYPHPPSMVNWQRRQLKQSCNDGADWYVL